MKAVYVEKFGSVDEIKVGKLPMPRLEKGQILVKTIATTVNNVDTFVRSGKYPIETELPLLLGRDVVGEIVEVFDDVSDFKVGDIVWSNSLGYEDRQGVSAEYLSVNEDRVFLLPEGIDPYQAVAGLHAATTAVLLLTDLVQTKPNQKILIQGGGGGVGRKLIETAKILDLDITTTSSDQDFTILTELGSTCLSYQDTVYTEKYDYLIDTSGKNSLAGNVNLLKENGKILMITRPVSTKFDAWDFYTNGKQILGFVLSKATSDQFQKAAKFMNDSFKKGYFLNDEIEKVPFTKIKKYHAKLEEGVSFNKRPVFIYS